MPAKISTQLVRALRSYRCENCLPILTVSFCFSHFQIDQTPPIQNTQTQRMCRRPAVVRSRKQALPKKPAMQQRKFAIAKSSRAIVTFYPNISISFFNSFSVMKLTFRPMLIVASIKLMFFFFAIHRIVIKATTTKTKYIANSYVKKMPYFQCIKCF